MSEFPPVIMAISGNDPGGGAGISADIEMLASLGAHTAPVISTLTVQDTCKVYRVQPVDPSLVIEQARCVLNELPVMAIKIGLLNDSETVESLSCLFSAYPEIPIVLDPVLRAGSGDDLATRPTIVSLREFLIPLCAVVTPNRYELRQLVPETGADVESAAQILIRSGCRSLLVTGADECEGEVINQWFQAGQPAQAFHWPRLPHRYHGSGCTLAAAIAGLLALGRRDDDAIEQAQETTWRALEAASKLGQGQWHPNRLSASKDRT